MDWVEPRRDLRSKAAPSNYFDGTDVAVQISYPMFNHRADGTPVVPVAES